MVSDHPFFAATYVPIEAVSDLPGGGGQNDELMFLLLTFFCHAESALGQRICCPGARICGRGPGRPNVHFLVIYRKMCSYPVKFLNLSVNDKKGQQKI